MDFSKFDIKILVVATFALLLISATAGATPIGGDFGEVPTYNQTASLNIEVPSTPGPELTTQGTLRTGPGIDSYEQERYIIRSDNLEVSVTATGYTPPNSTSVNVVLEYVNTTNASNPQTTLENQILNLSESTVLNAQDTSVYFEYSDNTSEYAEISWGVRNHPDLSETENGGGGLWAALNNIGEWIGYIAEILVFISEIAFAGSAFVFSVIANITGYVISLLGWITGGYGSIVGASPAWASPFLAIPPLALGFELMKLLIIIIEVLWLG